MLGKSLKVPTQPCEVPTQTWKKIPSKFPLRQNFCLNLINLLQRFFKNFIYLKIKNLWNNNFQKNSKLSQKNLLSKNVHLLGLAGNNFPCLSSLSSANRKCRGVKGSEDDEASLLVSRSAFWMSSAEKKGFFYFEKSYDQDKDSFPPENVLL